MKSYYITEYNAIVLYFGGNLGIEITKFAPWIARKEEDYNYKDAEWRLIKEFRGIDFKHEKDWTNDKFFMKTVELNEPFFNRMIIKTLFKA